MRITFLFSLLIGALLFSFACGGGKDVENAATNDTPTEAYKRLFNAVKAKNVDQIKEQMSRKTQEFAQMAAQRQNQPVEKVYENGFTGTTFGAYLPEIRDERIKGNFGAVEVWNSRDSVWEDLPFVLEDGSWKLAIGESFDGSYKSPGRGRDFREKEAANAARGGMPENVNANVNMMSNANTKVPNDPTRNKAK